MYYYAQDNKASELQAGDVIDSQRYGLIETPEPIVQVREYDGWIYFDFENGTVRARPDSNLKVYGGTAEK